jgi:hypothetical protein
VGKGGVGIGEPVDFFFVISVFDFQMSPHFDFGTDNASQSTRVGLGCPDMLAYGTAIEHTKPRMIDTTHDRPPPHINQNHDCLQNDAFDMDRVVETCVRSLTMVAYKKQIGIDVQASSDTPLSGNPTQLQWILHSSLACLLDVC